MSDRLITVQEMSRLAERRCDAWAVLSAAVKKTVVETKRLVEEGMLDQDPVAVAAFREMKDSA